jgi:glycerophosphoryl diester phosphodiesterase
MLLTVDTNTLPAAKAAGQYINVWTCNDPEKARRLRDQGVNALITDYPDVILKAISE